jgi:hypothetical protein
MGLCSTCEETEATPEAYLYASLTVQRTCPNLYRPVHEAEGREDPKKARFLSGEEATGAAPFSMTTPT